MKGHGHRTCSLRRMTKPVLFDASSGEGGIATEDFNATVLSWPAGSGVPLHTNDQVDVMMVCLSGTGEVVVDGQAFALGVGAALLIPKGSARGIASTSSAFRYVNLHRRKPGIQLGGMDRRPT